MRLRKRSAAQKVAEASVRCFVNRLMWYDPEWGVYRIPDRKFTRVLIEELVDESVRYAAGDTEGDALASRVTTSGWR